MPKKSVPASISEVAFDCPHCGAYTSQTWYEIYATERSAESRTPLVPRPDALERIRTSQEFSEDVKNRVLSFMERALSGLVFFHTNERGRYVHAEVQNLHLSKCFTCGEISVWIHDRLLFPAFMDAPGPNPDLPDQVRSDYEEAAKILIQSPRGAAALLRLGIQKLCATLGEKGKKIDDDIASLVKKGLSPLVQKALDLVRVIGNEAVHPGTLDLKDDRDTASRLFELVNIIAEQMISNPKHVEELYGKIPAEKRKAIERRNGTASE